MSRQHIGAALIISSALLAPRHARNRWLIVEETDAFAVLALMIFHYKAKSSEVVPPSWTVWRLS